MSPPVPDPAPELAALAAVDRVARAAALWLRQETAAGRTAAIGSPDRRELAAGLVWGLCQWLQLERPAPMLAAYACALLEQEAGAAVEVACRAAGEGLRASPPFTAGVRAAQSLLSSMEPLRVSPGPCG